MSARRDAPAIDAEYPVHLVEGVRLTDGRAMMIRPISPADAERERRFVRELSEETKRFRFMHAMKELSPSLLARFTRIDYRREMALVAMLEEALEPRQVGVARYVVNADGRGAEFAIVVGDSVRRRGIGMHLMHSLMHVAQRQGVERFDGEVHADNRPMRRLMEVLGFDAARSRDDHSLVRVTRELSPRQGPNRSRSRPAVAPRRRRF